MSDCLLVPQGLEEARLSWLDLHSTDTWESKSIGKGPLNCGP